MVSYPLVALSRLLMATRKIGTCQIYALHQRTHQTAAVTFLGRSLCEYTRTHIQNR
jgi:hypothetical protein